MREYAELLADFRDGLRGYRLWGGLGWLDIKLRYRRTLLGPFWVTVSFAISAVAMTFVFSTLFKMEIRHFMPYLTAGLAVWTLISALVTEGCTTYVGVANMVLDNQLPMSSHALRVVLRNLISFLHNLVVVFAVKLYFDPSFDWHIVLVLPAMALFVLNGLWVAILLGIACARYRDLAQAITLGLSVTFFVTPIFWGYDMLGTRKYLADFNPLFHFVEVLRAPLLSGSPTAVSWAVTIGITIVGWLVTLAFAARFRRRLPYWL